MRYGIIFLPPILVICIFVKQDCGSAMFNSLRKYTSSKPSRYLLAFSVVAVLAVAVLCNLPHNKFLRFNAVHDSSLEKVGWVFDRVTYDPEPIDVAFFGTSRMVFGIDSERVEKSYSAKPGGRCTWPTLPSNTPAGICPFYWHERR